VTIVFDGNGASEQIDQDCSVCIVYSQAGCSLFLSSGFKPLFTQFLTQQLIAAPPRFAHLCHHRQQVRWQFRLDPAQ